MHTGEKVPLNYWTYKATALRQLSAWICYVKVFSFAEVIQKEGEKDHLSMVNLRNGINV